MCRPRSSAAREPSSELTEDWHTWAVLWRALGFVLLDRSGTGAGTPRRELEAWMCHGCIGDGCPHWSSSAPRYFSGHATILRARHRPIPTRVTTRLVQPTSAHVDERLVQTGRTPLHIKVVGSCQMASNHVGTDDTGEGTRPHDWNPPQIRHLPAHGAGVGGAGDERLPVVRVVTTTGSHRLPTIVYETLSSRLTHSAASSHLVRHRRRSHVLRARWCSRSSRCRQS
jgi:hypothetical protein